MANDINALYGHLFDALQALKDKDNPMDIDRAKAISDMAQTIINTAKVEVEHAKVTGTKSSKFLDTKNGDLPNGITGITRHTIR